MVLEEGKLKAILEKQNIKSPEELQAFMRELYKEVIETLLDGELTDHLGYSREELPKEPTGDSRNGTSKKTVNTNAGKVELGIPRDRNGDFNPALVKKHQRDITGIEEKVIALYTKGVTTRDIQGYIQDIYGYEISPETVSTITDSVLPAAKEWQTRPLDPLYPIVFIDGIRIRKRQDGVVAQSTVYICIGYSMDGRKDCLGLYLGESESARFWLAVLNDLRNRGVEDVLIFACDNLTGISESISSAFPRAEIQKCIVHQIRNSLTYVPWADKKPVAAQLRRIYAAPNEKSGMEMLEEFIASPAGRKYPQIGKSWMANWGELSTFFKFSAELRKVMYTTNTIERFNCSIRKATKTKQIFPSDDSVLKMLYLVQKDILKKQRAQVAHWGEVMTELLIFYEDRLKPYLER